MKNIMCMLLALALLAAGVPQGLSAQTPDLAIQSWSTADGLPQNTVVDIAISPEGFIFAATNGGLGRFDGALFTSEDLATSPLWRTSRITGVEFDRQGRRFITTATGRVFRHSPAGWQAIESATPTPNAFFVNGLSAAPDGSMWMATFDGLYQVKPDSLLANRIIEGSFLGVATPPGGSVFAFNGPLAGVVQIENGSAKQISRKRATYICAGLDNDFYFGNSSNIFHYDGQGIESFDFEGDDLCDVLPSQAGGLFVLGSRQLFYKSHSQAEFTAQLSTDALAYRPTMQCFLEDPHGTLWIGTHDSGLLQATRTPLRVTSPKTKRSPYIDRISIDSEGAMLLRGFGTLSMTGGNMVEHIAQTQFNFSERSAGGFWTIGRAGLGIWQNEKQTHVIGVPDSSIRRSVVMEASNGVVWIATPTHLHAWDGERLTAFTLPSPSQDPSGFFEDSQGRIWLSRFSDLAIWDGSGFQEYVGGEQIPFGTGRAFYETSDGAIWCGTYGAGIFRIKGGKIATIDKRQGLFENTALTLIPYGEYIFVMGNNAVTRYRLADLEAVASGAQPNLRGRTFNTGPGIHMFEGNGFSPSKPDRHGIIWLSTLHGVGQLDPTAIPPVSKAIATEVHALSAAQPYQDAEHLDQQVYELEPDHREINLIYNAASFILPRQLTFRYRLFGLEDTWETSNKPNQIAYRKLPPGHYVFEIQAAEADGPFGPINSSIHVFVPRMLLEQLWFRYLLGSALALAIAGLVAVRFRAAASRAHELEAKVNARTEELRVAGDHLEHKVDLRTQELAHALSSLEADMQRRKQLEGRLVETEKLVAVGRLAGGLAHDFNNILTAILGEADLARLSLDPGLMTAAALDAQRQHLLNVSTAGNRAAQLTRQLLAYSRQQVLQPKVVRPARIVRELITMLRRLIPDNVELESHNEAGDESVLIDPGQLEQVIVNLVVNAAEAMPNGGAIVIDMAIKGRLYLLEVTDTGMGLAAHERERIFEPFYSSKGQGRGLGLASVQGIIVQSGGNLTVRSEPGHGSTFIIELPVTDQSPALPSPHQPASEVNGATVLLVDDESAVLRVAFAMLTKSGMRVFQAGSPEAALEIARTNGVEIDALVTDVVMPRMNGMQLSQKVLELCPGLPVLFISGYSAEVLTDKALLEPGANLLGKPFDSATLTARVAELVQSAQECEAS